MTPEELDEARAKEALRRLVDSGKVYCHEDIAALGARLAREGWTPPEPEPVDPDVLAFREWSDGHFRLGDFDGNLMATAFLAGARMARIKEHERAWVLVWALENIADADQDEISDIALNALAKYRGEA